MTKLKQIECCNFKEHRSFFTSEEGFFKSYLIVYQGILLLTIS